jgi:tRNA(fMet)-specific endonuclease VapC
LTRYLLDTTVLIAHLRGDEGVTNTMLDLLRAGHTLGTSCVNIAEVERGLRPGERRRAQSLIDRLGFLETTREAAMRAGRYQAEWARRGRRIHTPDALVAGTARAHGSVLVTDNIDDFPMRDIRIERPDARGDQKFE